MSGNMEVNRTKSASEGVVPVGITALNEGTLNDQVESRYECPICLNWLREPVITTCGHRFCKACITSWLQTSGHCPIDNINLTMKIDIFPDNYTRREIQEQRMSCPFTNKGCHLKVSPLELESHIATCEYNRPEPSTISDTKMPCQFKELGCKETFDNQEALTAHLQERIQNHLSYLMNAYSEIKIHKDMSSMEAKEQEAMALWAAPDKNNPEGASGSTVGENSNALIRALYERLVILEQRNREQDIMIANISKQLSAFTIAKRKQNNELALWNCMGTYIWRIDNFRARLDAMISDNCKMLYSPGFYTSPNGYRFCIRFNISTQNPQCFALHLHLMQTDYDECLDWPFNGRITIYMINQRNPELNQKDTMMSNSQVSAFRKPPAKICLRGFGYAEYALIGDVIRHGFIMNDTLIFKVSIKLV